MYVYSPDSLFANNEIYNGSSDCFELGGVRVVVRNNYCHDLNGTTSTEHIDFMQVIGALYPTMQFSLIEGNVMKNCINQRHMIQIRSSGTYQGGPSIADGILVALALTRELPYDNALITEHERSI